MALYMFDSLSLVLRYRMQPYFSPTSRMPMCARSARQAPARGPLQRKRKSPHRPSVPQSPASIRDHRKSNLVDYLRASIPPAVPARMPPGSTMASSFEGRIACECEIDGTRYRTPNRGGPPAPAHGIYPTLRIILSIARVVASVLAGVRE